MYNFDFLRNPQLRLGFENIIGQEIGGQGEAYYVDGNAGSDANDGKSWGTAFKKLSVAMAASHANIAAGAKGWAARNRIYFKADQVITADGENLVKFAQKTDIIGVGSTDYRAMPQLIGNHVIPGTTSYQGCRFYNISFKGPVASGGDIITMTSQHGIGFIGCHFDAGSTIAATGAIIATACVDLIIKDCTFKGAFSDAVIELGAGQADNFVCVGNLIQGANVGIDVPATVTFAAGKFGIIKDNVLSTTLECIKDAISKNYVIGNRGMTAAAKGVAMAGAVLCNLALAQDNRFSTSDANNVVYPANGSI